jgi:hypothetical protein
MLAINEGIFGLNIQANVATHERVYTASLRYDLGEQKLL